jgi:serine protease Do
MKTNRSTLLCLFGIAIGFGVGAGFNYCSINKIAQAEITKTESEQLQRELDAEMSALSDSSRVLAKVAKVVMPSVVHIQSFRKSPSRGRVEETGSGVIVTNPKREGYFIVTNRHVIIDALPDTKSISINLHDGRVLTPIKVWEDRYSDIAVMEVEANNLRTVRWGNSDDLDIGNVVLACGSPFGLSQSMTMGIISARGRSSVGIGQRSGVLNQNFLQTDAAINPGNSGGPLINLQGRLVGINTAIASTHGGNEGIGFSIPSNLVRTVVDQLLEHGEVRRAYLGVKLDSDFDYERSEELKLFRLRGARVLEIYPNTPAAKAQMKFNDVILRVDGKEVLDESHLINMVSLSPIGKSVKVEVWRDGKSVTLKVDLMTRPIRNQ